MFFTIKTTFNSSITFLAHAENYGDIKLEIRGQENEVNEEHHFLVNTKHLIYTKKIDTELKNNQLLFYPDRRHKTFASKGILIVGKNLGFHWIGPSALANQSSITNIRNYEHSTFTSLFSGFGDNAHFTIEINQSSLNNFIIPIIFIALISAIIVFAGQLSIKIIQRNGFLNQNKLRILILLFCVLFFLPINFIAKVILMVFLTYCTLLSLVRTSPTTIKNYKNFITASLLLILFVGFGSQAQLITNIKTELVQQSDFINFDIFDQFGKRFSELFAFKKEIGHLNSLIKVDIFERSPTSKVIIGKNGMMFEGTGERRVEGDNVAFFDNVSDYLGRLPFEENELKQWEQVLEQRNCWLKQQDIKYIFAIAPTKALVYPEFLPDTLSAIRSNINTQPRIQLLENHLKQNSNLPVVNLTHNLVAAKKHHDYPKLFYRTDFHWNYLGAYYAYEGIMKQLSSIYPDENLTPISLNKFDFDINPNWAHKTFLGLVGLLPQWYNNEHYVKLIPKSDNPIKAIEPYGTEGVFDIPIPRKTITSKSGNDYSVEYIENSMGDRRKILVLGDSFIQKVFPLISAHGQENYFSRAVFHFPHQLIETIQPDIVMQEILNMYLLRKPPTNSKVVRNAICN